MAPPKTGPKKSINVRFDLSSHKTIVKAARLAKLNPTDFVRKAAEKAAIAE